MRLVKYTPDPIRTIEEAACQCYQSSPTKGNKIAMACIRNGHQSVAEHATFTFEIEGVSRALLAQLTRHRVGVAFSVKSQRYVKEDQFEYVIPKTVQKDPVVEQYYKNAMAIVQNIYTQLLLDGIPPEDARFVLPNACATTLTCTMNLRELIHFCHERMCARAQWEIRELANAMRQAVLDEVNEEDKQFLSEVLVPKCETNLKFPFCTESKRECCGKHKRLEEVYHAD